MTREPLFTKRFFTMCAFSFTVFVSAFQLLPTAPFRILALGGSEAVAGLFLGFLTFASAAAAPMSGSLADRLGKTRVLIASSLVLAALATAYAFVTRYELLLAGAIVQGVFWSGLLSASSAYMADFIPASRRAEGIGYWGLSTNLAIAVAPKIGFSIYRHGWAPLCLTAAALNLVMAGIAWRLPEAPRHAPASDGRDGLVEWSVLVVAGTLFLYSFGYGGITSFVALYADRSGIAPKEIFFTTFAVTVVAIRPFSGPLTDRLGGRRVLIPSLAIIAIGLVLLATIATTRGWMVASGVVFAIGFGTAYPAFVAHVLSRVEPRRRGAAFGSVLAAFDMGVGTGSVAVGAIVEHAGFEAAYLVAAALAAVALPYFLWTETRSLAQRPHAF